MTRMETNLKNELLNKITERMAEKYDLKKYGKIQFFLSGDGIPFRVFSFPGRNALAIEYADSIDLAKKDVFGEDGDLFYIGEYNEKEMYDGMIKEIEG